MVRVPRVARFRAGQRAECLKTTRKRSAYARKAELVQQSGSDPTRVEEHRRRDRRFHDVRRVGAGERIGLSQSARWPMRARRTLPKPSRTMAEPSDSMPTPPSDKMDWPGYCRPRPTTTCATGNVPSKRAEGVRIDQIQKWRLSRYARCRLRRGRRFQKCGRMATKGLESGRNPSQRSRRSEKAARTVQIEKAVSSR